MTPDQQRLRRLWAYLSECWQTESHPTYREMAQAIGLKSTGAISGLLNDLVALGYIAHREHRKERAVQVLIPLLTQKPKEEA